MKHLAHIRAPYLIPLIQRQRKSRGVRLRKPEQASVDLCVHAWECVSVSKRKRNGENKASLISRRMTLFKIFIKQIIHLCITALL